MNLHLAIPLAHPVPIADIPYDIRLQIVGAVGAGFPSPAQDWQETAINLAELLRVDRAGSFIFRVDGHSMVDAGILDRDLVVVDRDRKPTNGKIVVAIVNGGFVVRQLVIRNGIPHLEARNSGMTYPVTIADEDVDVWGVVRISVHDFQG